MRYAGLVRRGLATLLDILLLVLGLRLLIPELGIILDLAALPLLFLYAIVSEGRWYDISGVMMLPLLVFLYFTLFEGIGGATLGKYLVGIRVAKADGRPPGLVAAGVRTLFRLLHWLLLPLLLDLVLVWLSSRHRRLGDLVAGTVVVRGRPVPQEAAVPPAAPLSPAAPPRAEPVEAAAPTSGPAPEPPPSPPGLAPRPRRPIRWGRLLAALALVAAAGLAYFVLEDDVGPTPKVNLGVARAKDPSPDRLIKTRDWGEVPANQVIVMLREGAGRKEAEELAARLGGALVGEIEFINLYQIEIDARTEAQLVAALDQAGRAPGVAVALPNVREYLKDTEGVRCGPLYDPPYSLGTDGRPYQVIGLQAAWDIIQGSGVKVNKVHVGVMDSALYKKSPEFATGQGHPKVSGLEAFYETDQPEKDSRGNLVDGGYSHGTQVVHMFAASPGGGGVAGVAGNLGDKLDVTLVDIYRRGPDYVPVDGYLGPQGETGSVGGSYIMRDLVDIKAQIEAGATVINASYGPEKPAPGNKGQSDIYAAFLRKMAKEHPKVLFVAAAGNENGALNGHNYSIGGHKLPNLITVGAIDNDGKRASFSNGAAPNSDGEVALAAPGVQVMTGVGPDGKPVYSSGTSFTAPQVTGAAALLRSINPDLTAADIKQILVETAAPGVPGKDVSVLVPKELGGKVLRVDNAVLKVINDLRSKKGEPPLTRDTLLGMGTIDARAVRQGPLEYTIVAALKAVPAGGTEVEAELIGPGSLSSPTRKQVSAIGNISWRLLFAKPGDGGNVVVRRRDTDACVRLVVKADAAVVTPTPTPTPTPVAVDALKHVRSTRFVLVTVGGFSSRNWYTFLNAENTTPFAWDGHGFTVSWTHPRNPGRSFKVSIIMAPDGRSIAKLEVTIVDRISPTEENRARYEVRDIPAEIISRSAGDGNYWGAALRGGAQITPRLVGGEIVRSRGTGVERHPVVAPDDAIISVFLWEKPK